MLIVLWLFLFYWYFSPLQKHSFFWIVIGELVVNTLTVDLLQEGTVSIQKKTYNAIGINSPITTQLERLL